MHQWIDGAELPDQEHDIRKQHDDRALPGRAPCFRANQRDTQPEKIQRDDQQQETVTVFLLIDPALDQPGQTGGKSITGQKQGQEGDQPDQALALSIRESAGRSGKYDLAACHPSSSIAITRHDAACKSSSRPSGLP